MIIVDSINKKELLNILSEDFYVKADVTDYKIIDVDFKLAVDDLIRLIENQ